MWISRKRFEDLEAEVEWAKSFCRGLNEEVAANLGRIQKLYSLRNPSPDMVALQRNLIDALKRLGEAEAKQDGIEKELKFFNRLNSAQVALSIDQGQLQRKMTRLAEINRMVLDKLEIEVTTIPYEPERLDLVGKKEKK